MTTDPYYTRPELARAIIAKLVEYGDIQPGDDLLDPCVGKGAFANAMRAIPNVNVTTIDEDPEVEADLTSDFLLVPPGSKRWHVVCSNPPFSKWQSFVERSVGILKSDGTVAFLLRLGVLGRSLKQKRSEFFKRYPITTIDVIWPRPSFTGKSDNSEYALFRWCPQDFAAESKAPQGFLYWEREKRAKKLKASKKSKSPKKPRKSKLIITPAEAACQNV